MKISMISGSIEKIGLTKIVNLSKHPMNVVSFIDIRDGDRIKSLENILVPPKVIAYMQEGEYVTLHYLPIGRGSEQDYAILAIEASGRKIYDKGEMDKGQKALKKYSRILNFGILSGGIATLIGDFLYFYGIPMLFFSVMLMLFQVMPTKSASNKIMSHLKNNGFLEND